MRADFERYRRWNAAIAQTVFGAGGEGRPVYLDLEEATLKVIAELAGETVEEPSQALANVVRSTLDLTLGPASIFRAHEDELGAWLDLDFKTVEPPPVVGVLAVMSLAAEAMGSGADLASHNYYGQLARLLGVSDEVVQQRLIIACRRVAKDFWSSLNLWVDASEGMRGIPTAYSVGPHPFVGLAISQALLRSDDRLSRMTSLGRISPIAANPTGTPLEVQCEGVVLEYFHIPTEQRHDWRRKRIR